MYVLGGYADGNVAQPLNEEYDPNRDMWRERAPLPQGANHIAVVGLESKLYAIGGFVEQNYHATADVWAYDPAKDTWAAVAPLPQPLGSMAVAAVDRVIHAIGGAGGTTIGDRHTIAVHALPLMPIARSGTQAAVVNNKIFVFGGEKFGGVFNNTELFDPATQRWSELRTKRSPIHRFVCRNA